MESSIFISGIALWVMLALFLIMMLGIIVIGCSYVNNEREKIELKTKNRILRSELKLLESENDLLKLKSKNLPQK